ncbi:MAG: flagellar motor switch protein FliN [Haliea sp.]|nr:flagellar motor switch protein FliN [Haliea sp.]|tara:strand:+ start:335381 stop:335752 length:372 start_codon:yes stop_codon:yes gene_type:complete
MNDVTSGNGVNGETRAADGEQEAAATASVGDGARTGGEVDLSLLLDVPITLSVEIGRTRVPISKLLSLSQGSVVELDRDISAPLDLMVNGMLIARGEVVESQGKFGLRLVDVVSPSERLKKLQ